MISYTTLDWLLPLPRSVFWCFSPGPAFFFTKLAANVPPRHVSPWVPKARKSWISNHCEVGWWKTCHSARQPTSAHDPWLEACEIAWCVVESWIPKIDIKIWLSLAIYNRYLYLCTHINLMQCINADYIVHDSKLAIHQCWTLMHFHGNISYGNSSAQQWKDLHFVGSSLRLAIMANVCHQVLGRCCFTLSNVTSTETS